MRAVTLHLLLAAISLYAAAACAHVSFAAFSASDRHFLLEVWLNGRNSHVIAQVDRHDGELWVSRAELAGYGVRLNSRDPAGRNIPLNALSGVHAVVDERRQRLMITTTNDRLFPQVFDFNRGNPLPAAAAGSGLVLNYAAVATSGDGYGPISGGGTLSATAFTPHWRLTSSGYAWARHGQTRTTRLDTALIFDEPHRLRQWVVGDSVSGGLAWSRYVRFAGIHVATDYSLQPDMRTFPLPQFIGASTVPTGVDVYIGQSKVLQQHFAPGPFEIRNLPLLTGRGEATVVVRDILGREQARTLPFFTSNRLLKPGLNAYSVDSGFLRRAYGERSFDYGAPVVSATFRHGVSDVLTVDSHGEIARDIALAGGGVTFAIQPWGVVQFATAASSGKRGVGGLVSASVNSQLGSVTLFGSVDVTSPRYADIGAIYGPVPPRRRVQAGMTTTLGERGNLAFSWLSVDGGYYTARLFSTSYSRSFGRGAFLGATALYSPSARSWEGQVFMSIPLGRQQTGSISTGEQNGHLTERLSLNRPASPDGGFGYGVSTTRGDNNITEGQATWVGQRGVVDAAVSSINGATAGRIGVSGAVVIMDGSMFATRQTGEAFALVRTGRSGVPIYRENRDVAVSNADGVALLTGLSAYAENRISIDPRDYPMDTVIKKTFRNVVPRRASGVLVDLTPKQRNPLLVTVRLSSGDFPPAGSRVILDGSENPLVMGRRGKIFLPDAPASISGTIEFRGESCRFQVSRPVSSNGLIPTAGPVTCSPGSDDEN